jgi:hypothetical protein
LKSNIFQKRLLAESVTLTLGQAGRVFPPFVRLVDRPEGAAVLTKFFYDRTKGVPRWIPVTAFNEVTSTPLKNQRKITYMFFR